MSSRGTLTKSAIVTVRNTHATELKKNIFIKYRVKLKKNNLVKIKTFFFKILLANSVYICKANFP